MILIMALFVSVFLGMTLALFFDMIDQTFKSPDDIVTHLKIPLLGSIPKRRLRDKAFVRDINEPTRYTAFYEDLVDQIYIYLKTQNLKTILIASPLQRELNFTIVPNIGYIFSKLLHHKTLIVDCNLRNPIYQNLLGVEMNIGLANLIENGISTNLIQKLDTDFDVIAAGSTQMNPVALMDKFNINEIFSEIKSDYEVILLDCTNIKNFSELIMISSYADGVVIVVNEGRDRKHVVISEIAPLKFNKVNIIGGILNNRTFKIPEVIYKRI